MECLLSDEAKRELISLYGEETCENCNFKQFHGCTGMGMPTIKKIEKLRLIEKVNPETLERTYIYGNNAEMSYPPYF